MSTSEAPWHGRSLAHAPLVTENALLAAILVLFMFLHIVAGAMLPRAVPVEPARSEQSTLQLYD